RRAREPQRHRHRDVRGLVVVVQPLRRDPRRSPSRQLHRVQRERPSGRHQSPGLRLHPYLPAEIRRRGRRPVQRSAEGRRRSHRACLRALGLQAAQPRPDRRAQYLGALHLRAAARRSRAQPRRRRQAGGIRPARGIPRAPGAQAARPGYGAARVRVHGPRGNRARRGVPASARRAQFPPAVQHGDRGFFGGARDRAPERGARRGRPRRTRALSRGRPRYATISSRSSPGATPRKPEVAPARKIDAGRTAMTMSRRGLMQAFAGGAALAAGPATKALAETPPVPPAEIAPASWAEGELKIVNFDLLEAEAKKVLPPGRFAFIGAIGDGWTYRQNRRAFNDFPINPRRLQGVSDAAIDMRVKLLGHELPFPMITCPMGGQGMIHVNAEVASAGGTGTAGTLYVSSGASTK